VFGCIRYALGGGIINTGVFNPSRIFNGATMLPSQEILDAAAALLAADTATLDNATDVEVILFKDPITPTPATVVGDLTPADFDGYAPLAKAASGPVVTTDPDTGDKLIRIPDPAGGWNWVTSGVTNLPQTIYGYALTDNTGADLYGIHVFDTPITLTAAGQGVVIGDVTFRMLIGGIV